MQSGDEEVAREIVRALGAEAYLEPGDLAALLNLGEHRTYGEGAVVGVERAGGWALGVLGRGALRSYLASPSGRELTLKYVRKCGGGFPPGNSGGRR